MIFHVAMESLTCDENFIRDLIELDCVGLKARAGRFIAITPDTILSRWSGEAEANVRRLFVPFSLSSSMR